MIEALGVPHIEVELILVNGDRVAVYPPLRSDGRDVAAAGARHALARVVERLDLAQRAAVYPVSALQCAVAPDRQGQRAGSPAVAGAGHTTNASTCDGCGRVYWEGSHWHNMRRLLDELVPNEQTGGTE